MKLAVHSCKDQGKTLNVFSKKNFIPAAECKRITAEKLWFMVSRGIAVKEGVDHLAKSHNHEPVLKL